MGIRWKTSEVSHQGKTYSITHWERHDPMEIMKALTKEPLQVKGSSPQVSVHEFRGLHLAVRRFPAAHSDFHIGKFELLKELAERNTAIVETPMALIREQTPFAGAPAINLIITLWKKRTQGFDAYLRDPAVPREKKIQACSRAVSLAARLNSEGFVHGHTRPDNFVIDTVTGIPSMVDYLFLAKGDESLLRKGTHPANDEDSLRLIYGISHHLPAAGHEVLSPQEIAELNLQYKKTLEAQAERRRAKR